MLVGVAVIASVMQVVASAAPPPSAAGEDPGLLGSEPPANDPVDESVGGAVDLPVDPGVVGLPPVVDPPVIAGYDKSTSELIDESEIEDVYRNADGSVSVVRHPDAVRVEEEDGSFIDVDPVLEKATTDDLAPAADEVSGVADQEPLVKPKEHPLDPVFGQSAEDGTVSIAQGGVSVRITPEDAPASVVGERSGERVTYPEASEGSDVVYEVTAGTVKESIIVDAAPGESGPVQWPFVMDVVGATPRLNADGSVEFVEADGSVSVMIPVPYSFDSSGAQGKHEPADTNGWYSLEPSGGRWVLTVHMDRAWMNDPARVYPVTVDPSIMPSYFNDARSVKSDGTVVMGAPIRFGNPNEPGGAKWRGLVHWDYSKYFNQGYQLVNAEVDLARTGGTANAYAAAMWTANGYGFANAGTIMAYTPYFGHDATLIGEPLIKQMRSDFNTSNGGPFYMFVGDERNGAYTYKSAQAEMVLTLNGNATSPTLTAPSNGAAMQSTEPVLSASATDPDQSADPVYYAFHVSTTPDIFSGVVWNSGWQSQSSVKVPANTLQGGVRYYWRAYSKDYCHLDTDPCGYGNTGAIGISNIWSFGTNRPPVALAESSASPPSGTVATTTPTLTVGASTDPDGSAVQYRFQIVTGTDGRHGQIISSGWQSGTSWTVPAGYLQNGVQYSWTAQAWDGTSIDQGSWSHSLLVDQRIGDPKTSPTDSLGAASVNLTNGNLIFSTSSPTASFAKSEVGLTYTYNSQTPTPPSGLKATYYIDSNQNQILDPGTDKQVLQRIEPQVAGNWTGTSPYPGVVPNDHYLTQWTGYLTVPTSGSYLLGAQHDDGVSITVNGNKAYESTGVTYAATWQSDKPISLTAGKPAPITITYNQINGNSYLAAVIKRVDGAALYSGGPAAAWLPSSWLSTGTSPALPQGWNLSTDVDGDATYMKAVAEESSITLFDAAGTPHVYTKVVNAATGGVSWAAPAGEQSVLSQAGNGEITVNEEDGSRTTFASDGAVKDFQGADVTGTPTALQYTYSGSPGRLSRVMDPVSGLALSMTYGGAAGCYAGQSAPAGASSTAPGGMLCRVDYPDGSSSVLWYDAGGRLSRLSDPGGENTDFSYDASNRMVGVRDAAANDALLAGVVSNSASLLSQISYDSTGRVSKIASPVSAATGTRQGHTYTYSSAPSSGSDGVTLVNIDGVTPASGYSTRVTFNSDYRATSSTDALGRVTRTEYNAKDQLLKTTDPAGRVSTTIYDYADRPVAQYGPAPASCFTGYTPSSACTSTVPATSTSYDEGLTGLAAQWWNNTSFAGAPAVQSLGLGAGSTATAANYGTGSPVAGVNADDFSMRATGYVTFAQTGQYTFAVSADDTARVWIGNMLLNPASYGAASTTLYQASAGSTVPIKIEYTENTGEAVFAVTWQPPGSSGQQTIPTSAVNPGYGLVTTQTTADTGSATPQQSTRTSYGDRPWEGLPAVEVEDPSGQGLATSYTYDSLRRRTTRTLPSGATYTDAYYGNTEARSNPCVAGSPALNQAGRLKTSTDPVNSDGYAVVTEVVYDLAGRVVASRIVGDASWTCTSYDTRGRPTSTAFPAVADDPATSVNESMPARTVTNNYAVGGDPRVNSTTDPAGAVTTTGDLTGKITTYIDASGVSTNTSYDAAGRVTGETTTSGGVSSVTAYTYNDASQITATKLDGQTVSTPVINSTSGEITGASYGNGASSAITRDGAGNVASLAWAFSGRTITSTVTRSQSGRVTTDAATDSTSATGGYAWSYAYDTSGRLASANLAAAGSRPALGQQYAFAASSGTGAGNCVSGAGKNTNRTSMSITRGGSAAGAVSYCYDAADRATTDSTGLVYSYDKHGNTTRISNTTTGDVTVFLYDSADRHVKTITPNGTGGSATITYTRDASGRITARTSTGASDAAENTSTIYGYSADGDTPDVYAAAGTKALTQRVLALDAGASITKDYTNAANTTWAYPNIHGDTITTTTGTSAANTNPITCYDPYGTPITSTAQSDADAAPNTAPGAYDPTWLGQQQRYTEHTSALNYTEMGQRVYNPATGRFQQTDPIEGGSANNYDYVNADPINALDLNGTWTWKGLWKGAKKFLKKHRGTIATVAAAAVCIGTAGAGCALAQAGAWAVRSQQRGFRNVKENAADAILTVATFGFNRVWHAVKGASKTMPKWGVYAYRGTVAAPNVIFSQRKRLR